MKMVFGSSAGVVVNVVAPAPDIPFRDVWIVDDATVVSVGDPYDPKDPQIDAMDVAVFRILFRHENMIRELIRAVRVNNAISTAATNEGLPTTANAPDLTLAQARAAFKALIP